MNAPNNLPAGLTENSIPAARPAPDLSWEQFADRYPSTADGIERAYYQRAFEALMAIELAVNEEARMGDAAHKAVADWRVYSREAAIKFVADREFYNKRWVEPA